MDFQKTKNFLTRSVLGRIHRQYKDRLFRFLFARDREALLQIYNALNETDYSDSSQLKIVTIENAVYVEMKNDLAFVVTGVLNMYEHQSTYNPNMPVRFLMYLAQEYHKVVEQAQESLYSSRLISLPTPQCIVFYNGTETMPEEKTLRLSDAFENKKVKAGVELEVRMLNINYGHNMELMEHCRLLKEYAEFVEIARKYASQIGNAKTALNAAIDYCIENNILGRQLRLYRAEVLDIMLGHFDRKKYERSLKREAQENGYREGYEAGKELGTEHGVQQGIQQGIHQGIEALILDNLEENIDDGKILLKLQRRFQLTPEQAKEHLKKCKRTLSPPTS